MLADKLHKIWIRNCFQNNLADRILVYKLENEPAGFIACKIEKFRQIKYGRIVLVGISSEFQGKGIGGILIKNAKNWFFDNNCRFIIVRTEAKNYPAIKVYQKNNFYIAASSIYLRKYP